MMITIIIITNTQELDHILITTYTTKPHKLECSYVIIQWDPGTIISSCVGMCTCLLSVHLLDAFSVLTDESSSTIKLYRDLRNIFVTLNFSEHVHIIQELKYIPVSISPCAWPPTLVWPAIRMSDQRQTVNLWILSHLTYAI